MTAGYPKPPSFISILLGIFACILLGFAVSQLASLTKWTGYLFLIIPDKLGIIKMAKADEIIEVDFSTNPTFVYFPEAGPYNLYTNNLDLLSITDSLIESEKVWLVITPLGSEKPLQVLYFTRGLFIYDSAYAKGRPIYYFEIPSPGYYKLKHPTRPIRVTFLPDYNTFNEEKIILAYVVQLLLVGIPFGYLIYRRWSKRMQPVWDIRKQKLAETEKFWQNKKSTNETEDDL
ncbi:MAG: hypothetical protein JXA13_13175 [Anaerolineales bacterium]|nr:hypothetical protein [Anaerolineales bacterium]